MRSTRTSVRSAFVSGSSFSPSPLKAFCCYFPVVQSRSYCSTASSEIDGLVLGVFKGRRLSSAAKALDDATNGEISKRLNLADSMKGDAGNSLLLLNLSPKHPRVALMGLGKDPTVVRTALFLFLTHGIRWIARGKGNPRSWRYVRTIFWQIIFIVNNSVQSWRIRGISQDRLLGLGWNFFARKVLKP